MEKLYLVTGANGHLGNTIIRSLVQKGASVRGLLLPHEQGIFSKNVAYCHGDIRDIETIEPLFQHTENREVIVLHTAGMIDISEHVTNTMYQVNVNGTKNMISLCQKYQVSRLVYVSSVHAIPEKDKLKVLNEIRRFSPDQVTGGYAKTKAAATQAVLDAVRNGLNAVVVHPSGILGPYDSSGNHLVQMVYDYMDGKLPACVNGGYDFVDVRDVADGCLAAAEKGSSGECYILSNRHYEIKEVLNIVKSIRGGKKLVTLPMWMAQAAAPLIGWVSKCRKRRPLYTKYSLYTLSSNDKFSHDKATTELNYHPRDLFQTIADTVAWMKPEKITG